ncbi:hypothetical protein PGUG_02144 [Meyerozyma guilliermondii ATCC 6260]|uniref:Tetratricopeptide SHNi-TPR domain-containing protein n=1 Tax=Meyerozyma guilliermondii (strain ATCC 6260 / CBS 566 / DSM 6381 / JCM 1539 / NBRC 10279 / NRRL Y-324) TaxID=294746 RepID=A5DFU3_PICGU|nr:uncharacterized protein PGUG_02144 [Meyerozyma guilliermondii ATCC 6260]EDK38046.2 hypothetical protein PGUG_02144 [Meyerozyma guilliermondii ATCC 6260]
MAYSSTINALVADANKLYAQKDFEEAALKYGEACESYSSEYGAEDADLLNLYGKALFQNAVSRSEVFGGVGAQQDEPKKEDNDEAGNFQFHDDAPLAEEDDTNDASAPIGHEEQETSDNEDKENEPEEDQSDFEVAWEILDLARSLFEQQLEKCSDKPSKTPYLATDSEEPQNKYVTITKKLSEVYDLLGEVSLESENFPQAAADLQKSLELREQLYDSQLSALVSESHYKLSLALEFCVEDPNSRAKSAEQMRLAIASVERRNETEKNEAKKKDNLELLNELKERYADLRKDPAEEFDEQKLDIIKGILGEASETGEKSDPNKAKRTAVNDLSGMVKKKKPKK